MTYSRFEFRLGFALLGLGWCWGVAAPGLGDFKLQASLKQRKEED